MLPGIQRAIAYATAVAIAGTCVPARADEPAPPTPTEPTPEPAPAPPPAAPVQPQPPSSVKPEPVGPVYTITSHADRSTKNVVVLGSIAGGAAVLGLVGVAFNLDSQAQANKISLVQATAIPWTAADQKAYDRAHSSGVVAGVFYGLGGAALITAAIAYIVTAPKEEVTAIRPHGYGRPQPTVAPTPGGAILGGAWTF